MLSRRSFYALFPLLSLIAVVGTAVQCRAQFSEPGGSALSIPESDRMQPAALAKLLGGQAADKPLVLQVGSRLMFEQAHIPGSAYAGAGSQATGLQMLEGKVASAGKNKLIVIYCGCCPWTRCPNVAPAYKHLHQLGFTNVKVLYIPNNFGDDWVGKGFPAARGE